jgi:hypothetical protein
MAGTSWMAEAACVNVDHVDWFDLDCGLEAALTYCATCPVGDLCLEYAITNGLTEGIWGGEWGSTLVRLVTQKPGEGSKDG